MSAKITLDNFPLVNQLEKGEINADAAVGATALTLKNNQGFAATDVVLLGNPGADGSELSTISAVNADQVTVTVGATKLKHVQHERITKLYGTQAKIYRAPNTSGNEPADSAFTLLATVTLEPDQPSSTYNDAAGSSDYWYKYTYYNPTSLAETDRVQSPAVRGEGDSSANYCLIDDVREEAGFKNATYITDAMIDVKRQAAQAEINAALGGYYSVPFQQPVNAFITDITRRLAAGLLLLEQFGAFDTQNTQNGQKKVDGARADYKDLQAGSKTLKDQSGASIATTGTSGGSAAGFSGWPNDKTGTTGQQYDSLGAPIAGSGDFSFRVDDRY